MSDVVLVIGASGFLGQGLVTAFQDRTVVGTFYARAQAGLEFLDLCDRDALRGLLCRLAPSIVIYAAGLTDVDACEKNPALAWRLNVEAAAEVAVWGRARIVYISTDYVFDGTRGLYTETDEANPINVYGRTKLAGERLVLEQDKENLVVRVSGLYDATGVKGQDFSSLRPPLISDDTRLSSPVHVEDVASAIRLLLDSGKNGVYHVAGPDRLSRYEFWQLVALRTGVSASSRSLSDETAPRPGDSSLRSLRMEALGWRARRACVGLPPLAQNCLAGVNGAPPSDEDSNSIDALLIDCVGGLLTCRTWLPSNDQLDEIDKACAVVTSGPEFWKMTVDTFGFEDADLQELVDQVAFRYSPNPPVWGRLREWRNCYKLALVNNGPAETFHRWVRKYGLDDVFGVLVNSEEMGVRKPEQEFFLAVADRLGVVPERCLLLDDDPANVDGARRCGLRAIGTHEQKRYPLSIYMWGTEAGSEVLLGGRRDG